MIYHRILILVFFVLSFFNGQSYDLQYLQKQVELESIVKEKEGWLSLSEKEIYNGLDNGVYWFRIKLDDNEKDLVLSIPWAHVSKAKLYLNDNELPNWEKQRFITFKIPDQENRVLYLKVDCTKEAIIPISILEKDEYLEDISNESLLIGFYNGFVFAAILINLMFFYAYGNKVYVYYILILISLTLGIFYREGTLHAWFLETNFLEHVELLISVFIGYSGMLLCVHYMGLDHVFPKLKNYGLILIGVTILLYIWVVFTNDFLVMCIGYILLLLILAIFWGSSFLLFRENDNAKFIAVAYGLMLMLAYDHFIFPHFGIHSLEVPLFYYRVGGFIEIIVFTFAISYASRNLNIQSKIQKSKIVEYLDVIEKINNHEKKYNDVIGYFIGEYSLTFKEAEVLKAISEGLLNKEIADELSIGINTVKFHIRNIFNKLDVKSKKEARLEFLKNQEKISEAEHR